MDYEALLHVTDDGYIWWQLKDAIRLGAGYRPFSDDQRVLVPELRPLSQLVLVNERTLIGAFSDDRLKLKRPLTFERDGLRYVDAEGFLDWLSEYIGMTEARMTFPTDLASQVRRARAKAAAVRLPIASQRFVSLAPALEGWFEKKCVELPDALSKRLEREFSPVPWDALSADDRRRVAQRLHYQHDPTTEQDRIRQWDLLERESDLERKIADWQAVAATTADELDKKETKLDQLRQELAAMKNQDRPVLDESAAPAKGHLNHDLQMQKCANGIAAELSKGKKRGVTRIEVAKLLAKELNMGEDTVLRRIRKQW